jgi:hypothetical protein
VGQAVPETAEAPSSPASAQEGFGGQAGSTTVFDTLTATPPKDLLDDLVSAKRTEIGEKERLRHQQEGQTSADQARVHKAFEAEGVGPDTLPKKWDAELESKKHAYDPVEAFGSFGSVFGILASAFTHMPMDSALNAAASAMNAVKAGKEDEYKRAYQAWKDNTDLAVKRHEMQHQVYQDAIKLMETDQHAGQVALQNAASRFGDQQSMLMIQHGMIPELYQTLDARNNAALGLTKAQTGMTENHEKVVAYLEVRTARDELAEAQKTGEQPKILEATQKLIRAQQRQRDVQEGFAPSRYQTSAEMDARLYEEVSLEHPDWTTARKLEEIQHRKTGGTSGGGVPGMGKEEAMAVEEELKKNPGMPRVEAIAKVKRAAASITGNKQDELRSRIDMYSNSLGKIDQTIGVLDHYIGAAGIAGKATRTGERVSNIFGSKNTDRVQFSRDIEYLQAVAPRLLTDSQGRPLSAEAKKITDIIGGLSLGDTTANTKRSLEEVKRLYTKMRGDVESRLEGKWTGSPAEGGQAPPEKPIGRPKWQEAPVVQ